jgi:hypothetical protein
MDRQKDLCRLDSRTVSQPVSKTAQGWIQDRRLGGYPFALTPPLAASASPMIRDTAPHTAGSGHKLCSPSVHDINRNRAEQGPHRRA